MSVTLKNTVEFDSSGQTILVIDDNPLNLKVIADHLETFGFEVSVAQDGEGGLERVQFVRPDLILLDVKLPGIDGFEVCRRLKATKTTKDIPVIFMTVLTDTEHKLKGFQVGAVDYITKPFQQAEVLVRITTHLRLRELTERLEQKVQERTRELAITNQQLHRINDELARQIAERKQVEEELRKHRDHLEELVAERTAEQRKIINTMAGREIRMAGLKEVIKKLRTQLQEAGLTPVAGDPLLGGREE